MPMYSRCCFLLFVAFLAGCSTIEQRADAIAGTPFYNGGVSMRSKDLLKRISNAKGIESQEAVNAAQEQLALDFSSVVAQCKAALENNDSKLQRSNNWALSASLIGLVAGVGGSALAAQASASKTAIAALSGIAGATNSLQHQLKQTGYDAVEYTKRSVTIRESILLKTREFQEGDLTKQQSAMRDLVASCVAYS